MPGGSPLLLTVGHGTQTAEHFSELVRSAGVRSLVDIRMAPGSRRRPHFRRDELDRWLPEAGITYRWDRRLGGFRRLPSDSPDVALRNSSFRAYAAHMRTGEFADAVAQLVVEARGGVAAVMCSESVWWRCHRRLVADHAVLVDSVAVRHLMPDGRLIGHVPTTGVRREHDHLVYDALPSLAGRLGRLS